MIQIFTLNTIILLYHKCNILNVQALKRDNYFYITKIKSYFYLFLIKLDFYLLIKLCFYLLVIKLCFYVYLIKLYVYFLIIKFYLYIFLIKLCFKINESTFFLFLIKLYSFKNQFLLFKQEVMYILVFYIIKCHVCQLITVSRQAQKSEH